MREKANKKCAVFIRTVKYFSTHDAPLEASHEPPQWIWRCSWKCRWRCKWSRKCTWTLKEETEVTVLLLMHVMVDGLLKHSFKENERRYAVLPTSFMV